MSDAAATFAALGDPHRLAIVERLCARGPLPTPAVRDAAPAVTRQGVTKHLRVLEQAGLVASRRIGRAREWRVRAERLAGLGSYLEQAAAQWDARLRRLEALLAAQG